MGSVMKKPTIEEIKKNAESSIKDVKEFDNQLIQLNDTLYYRIHVRVDTSYFVQEYSDQNLDVTAVH